MKGKSYEDFVLAIGIVIAIAVAVVMWLTLHEPLNTVIIALLLVVITLIGELLVRTRRYAATATALSKLGEVIYTFQPLRDFVIKAVDDYEKVARLNNASYLDYAHSCMTSSNATLHDLSEGIYRVPPLRESEGLIDSTILEDTRETFKATSFGDLEKWWSSPGGKTYLSENVDALKRGIPIIRIFIYQDHNSRDALARIVAEQMKLGIDVWLIHARSIPEHLREDYIISDGTLVSFGEVSTDGMLRKPVISINDYEVKKYISHFCSVKRFAQKADDWQRENAVERTD